MAALRRVLSVQSHVVHGYVGNRAAVFPLQLLGFEVDVINSVQFSCHTGYPAITGQRLTGDDLHTLVQGLATNQVLNHSHLLTGYIGTASFLREVIQLREMLPKACRYICDPVLGDNGQLYVPQELVELYRTDVLQHVSILTPNQFEAELLTGRTISSLQEAANAIDQLHGMGPPMVVITSLGPDSETEITMMLSEVGKPKWVLNLPLLPGGPFTGTGDLTAAMLLAWTQLHPYEAPLALEKVGAILQAVIRLTVSNSASREIGGKTVPPELRIIESKRVVEEPPVSVRCGLAQPLNLKGVVFDMDGTLTQPGQLDMQRMRERTGVPEHVDIVPYLRELHAADPEALARAMAIIDEEEQLAFQPPKLQPGCKESLQRLLDKGVKLGIFTRNSPICVDKFLQHLGLREGAFWPIITRESELPNKPNPAPVLHCCEQWGLPAASVLVVGDSVDDVVCGRAAGSSTVGVLEALEGEIVASDLDKEPRGNRSLAAAADFTVSSLDALRRFFP